ncbi:hypothetical protein [Caenispirillum bisanense]|uniref:Cache domain-containing protein n=1 Tax=Caenispirillum bisanense TaxID=414052 RepID=A0A286GMD2_9PROT|nr:hypothetical protein [Caenispirillum bisanense]SOD96652.1 Cache domain-containing protein [Caenispirillum bisanense]
MLRFRKADGADRGRSIYSFDTDDSPRYAVKRWLALFAIGVVLLGVIGHVSYVRETTFQSARSQGLIAANLLSQNSARLFDMAEYLAVDLDGRIGGRGWDAIAVDRELWEASARAVARFPYVSAASLFDTTGDLRFTTLAHPAPSFSARDRDYFRAHLVSNAPAQAESIVSRPLWGTVGNRPIFFVSRGLKGPDGSLIGVIGVSLRTDYFKDFLETFQLPFHPTLQLVRQKDGTILAREPGEPLSDVERVGEKVRASLASGRLSQSLETDTAIVTVQRLPQWPVYAVVSFDRAAVDAAWKAAVVDFVVIGAVAIAALIALAALAPGRRLEP